MLPRACRLVRIQVTCLAFAEVPGGTELQGEWSSPGDGMLALALGGFCLLLDQAQLSQELLAKRTVHI
ncbi:hypothetical protein CB1_000111024 [Camelus ferus]|nr:hypothetical protein CB1_000111024 [Camelus ferus]